MKGVRKGCENRREVNQVIDTKMAVRGNYCTYEREDRGTTSNIEKEQQE